MIAPAYNSFWLAIRAAIHLGLDRGNQKLLKQIAANLPAERLRAHADDLSDPELLAIVRSLNPRQRREAIKLMPAQDRQRLRQAVREAYVDFMAQLPIRRRSKVLHHYLRIAPTLREPFHVPANWINEQGELHHDAAYAYVLNDHDYPLHRVALHQLAWSALASGSVPLPQPVDLVLNKNTPLPDALRFMNLGGWDELPVVDEHGVYCGVIYKEVLLKQLMKRWRRHLNHRTISPLFQWILALLLGGLAVWLFVR